ncbi:unnamed protein product [Echinostoma caproni]|uniref:RT_RNaseH domain-containing protein n=1 Tax=Echinostoma caproni TaxID=27848 RepID=A0A183B488_9TREM|nr:unnamed protein product [Echinostoma caproni]
MHTHLQHLVVKCSNNTLGMNVQPTKLEVDGEPIFLKRRVLPYAQRDGVLQALEKMNRDGTLHESYPAAIDEIIRGLDGVLAYQDDVIVFGKTKAEHDDRLLRLLERFSKKNVSIRASKCMFSSPELEFSGFTVDAKGYRPDPSRFPPLTELESPRNQNQLISIMGCLQYYSRFILNFATKAQPLFAAQSTTEWKWTTEYEQILRESIQMITGRPVLASFCPTKHPTLITDALDVGIGAVLERNGCPIVCISRLLNKGERGYSQTQNEALAVYWAVRCLHKYLFGLCFTMVTDHQALKYLFISLLRKVRHPWLHYDLTVATLTLRSKDQQSWSLYDPLLQRYRLFGPWLTGIKAPVRILVGESGIKLGVDITLLFTANNVQAQ